jgi:hypothetical protein
MIFKNCPVIVAVTTSMGLLPAEASAGWWQEITDRVAAIWAYGKASTEGELVSAEQFAAEAPMIAQQIGKSGLLVQEIEISDGEEKFTLSVSQFKDKKHGRPLVVWLDKIEGNKTTRYADLGCDGYLDGVTFDGKPVLTTKAMAALATGNLDMASAVLGQAKEEAERYQPMFQADCSKVLRLARGLTDTQAD